MSEWHPILAAVEREPASWVLFDSLGREYGAVTLRRTIDGLRYRCSRAGGVVGWSTSLRLACEALHALELRSHGPGNAPPEMYARRG